MLLALSTLHDQVEGTCLQRGRERPGHTAALQQREGGTVLSWGSDFLHQAEAPEEGVSQDC